MFAKLQQIYTYDFTQVKFATQTVKFISLNLALFLIPFIFGQPQLLIGSIVNFGLIYMALNFKKNELLPAIFLPSIASLLHGVVWGPLTLYIAVLMPVIWLGNALLVLGIRFLVLKKLKVSLSIVIAGIAKTALLFTATLLLVAVFKFPEALLLLMGVMQLSTIFIAGIAYLLLSRIHITIKD